MTERLCATDAYLATCEASVTAVTEGGVVLDRTVFYARGGGQPGDTGLLRWQGGEAVVTDTVSSREAGEVVHVLAEGVTAPAVGTSVTAEIDWPRRHRLMRTHTALHALSGVIFTTDVATTSTLATTWASAQPRQGYVSSIAVDPVSPLTAYATYSTYNFGTQIGHVFRTTNGGGGWTRIDLSLPDMPVHSVVVHPTRLDTLYIGTDLGVFVTTDGGASWMRENTGFANVVVEHLQIVGSRLFAFTHGRSAWSVLLAQ